MSDWNLECVYNKDEMTLHCPVIGNLVLRHQRDL